MKLLNLSLKNIFNNWWRSLTLGIFIFIVSFILVFFNSSVTTMKNNMENTLINALTGDVLVRPSKASNDVFTIDADVEELEYLSTQQTAMIEATLKKMSKSLSFTKRVRQNVLFVSDKGKNPAMIFGIESQSTVYQKAIKLIQGRYIQGPYEVILNVTQARTLKVKIGEKIGVLAQTSQGFMVDSALTIVGIGNIENLSASLSSIAFTDLQSAQELMGFQSGEATDLMVYTFDKNNANKDVSLFRGRLKEAGLNTSEISVAPWKNQGGYFMDLITIYVVMFYCFIAILLFITGILIVNLIFMMGLERRQEIGTLRAIGFSQFHIIKIFMSEILLITSFFCILGFITGSGLVLAFSKVALKIPPPWNEIMGNRFQMQFNMGQIISGIILILGFSIAVSFYPSFKAASMKPAETLKEN